MDGWWSQRRQVWATEQGDNIICSNKYHCGDILYNSQDIVTALAPLSLRQSFFYFPAAHTKQNILQNGYLSQDPDASHGLLCQWRNPYRIGHSQAPKQGWMTLLLDKHKSLSQKVSIQSWQKQNNWLKQNPTFSLQFFKQNHVVSHCKIVWLRFNLLHWNYWRCYQIATN